MEIGRSYLPEFKTTSAFIAGSARAIQNNPQIAAEITFAATSELITHVPASELAKTMTNLVRSASRARDASL